MKGSVELVRLKVVSNEIEAEQVRSILDFEGIKSMQRLTDYGAGTVDAGAGQAGAREILVRAEDLDAARELIAES